MSRHATTVTRARRRRSELVAIAAGVTAAVVLALSFSGTFSVFTQAFVHGTNTVSTSTIRIVETAADGSPGACTTAADGTASCTDPDLYGGGSLRPGESSTTQTISFANTGTATPTGFRLTGGPCTTAPTSGSDLCSQLVVKMTWRGADVLPASTTPAFLAANAITLPNPPAAGERFPLTVQVSLPGGATAPTSGVTLSQSLTFTFSA
ncbi:hypothetical protein [Curtobacterium oceanosedimentum]|uniref:Uncharacterized protein n=1 Tax=Curtobacterium oceanosedimentum TaxID=465820 RepID=A0A147DT63_9MICO|nr:hypothetical protein [Curtobacterium oceanosedimentum]KTR53391.1 hypothetical protein NS359_03365 [Curtobacterium oceanosedimentum]